MHYFYMMVHEQRLKLFLIHRHLNYHLHNNRALHLFRLVHLFLLVLLVLLVLLDLGLRLYRLYHFDLLGL
jgi:hypothetical protein